MLLLQLDSRHDLRSPGLFCPFFVHHDPGGGANVRRILAFWLFILAAFFPAMGAYVTFAGLCPIEAMIQSLE